MSTVHFSSTTDDWETPPDFFNRLNSVFHFTLDVCASASNAKVPRYFSIAEDGLKQNWDGERVWMNPPYGRDIGAWMKKASEANALVVCLVPARTDTRWWHDFVVDRGGLVVYLKGRLKFGKDGRENAPFPSAIVIYTGNALQSKKEQQRLI